MSQRAIKNWLKVKCNKRQEFVIAGYTPSKKGFPGFGSLILGVYDKGKLIYAGRVGTGFSIKQRLELQKKLDRIAQTAMPFAVKPKDPGLRDAHWAKPKLVAKLSLLNGLPTARFGIHRFRVCVRIRRRRVGDS